MFHVQGLLALEHLKDVPGFKAVVKAVLKNQIQILLEQLAKHTDEESIVLSASVPDGVLSWVSSEQVKGFLEHQEDVKSQFFRYCMQKHHQKIKQETNTLGEQSMFTHVTPGVQNSPLGDHQYPSSSIHGGSHRKVSPVRSYKKALKRKIEQANQARHISKHHFVAHIPRTYSQYEQLGNHSRESAPQLGRSDLPAPPAISTQLGNEESLENGDREMEASEAIKSVKEEQVNADSAIIYRCESVRDVDESEPAVTIGAPDCQSETTRANSVVFPPRPGFNMIDWSSAQEDDPGPQSLSQTLSEEALQHFSNTSFGDLKIYDARPVNLTMSSTGRLAKKRVYRKVECEYCSKMVYITNIKVHRYRHMQQNHEPRPGMSSNEQDASVS